MKRNLDQDIIFPIRDRASAILMRTKADCLHTAGDDEERNWVHSKAEGCLRPVKEAA